MEIKRGDQVAFDPKPQMSRIFVEGFYPWIKHICKDKDRLINVFAHMFDLERFYVAVDAGQIAAMAACTDGTSPVVLDRKIFAQVLGLVRGNISYFILRRHMMCGSLPFAIGSNTGVIEFVATAPEFRQQGMAQALLSHVMAALPFDTYMLEVADNNAGALRLYEKLGFKEIKRIKASKRSGINEFVYMRHVKV